MSSDGSEGTDPHNKAEAAAGPSVELDHLLLEGLMHVLIEKGVLTKTDAMSIVETAAQVRGGRLHEGQEEDAPVRTDLQILRRMYSSFGAVADRGVLQMDGKNVHRLRPPIHGDRPEFPRDDD